MDREALSSHSALTTVWISCYSASPQTCFRARKKIQPECGLHGNMSFVVNKENQNIDLPFYGWYNFQWRLCLLTFRLLLEVQNIHSSKYSVISTFPVILGKRTELARKMAGKFALTLLTQHAKIRQYWNFNQNPRNPAQLTHCWRLHTGNLESLYFTICVQFLA